MTPAALVLAAALHLGSGQPAPDADLALAMKFVSNGDFPAAEEVLRAVTATLEGQPGKMRELADAYLYLAISQLEQDRPKEASRNFFEARRRNKALTLSQYQFSRQVRRAFDEAASGGEAGDDRVSTPAADTPTVPAEPWIESNPGAVALRMALGTDSGKCDGTISIDSKAKRFSWTSAEPGPCASFSVALGTVRPATAAMNGGVALSFVNDTRPRMILMPAPSGGVFESGVEEVKRSDLSADTNVEIRVAIRQLNQFIEGGASPGLKESLYGVAVDASLAELMDTPGAFDGSTVRTRGRFDVISRDRNQYLLTAETFMVMVSPDPEAGVAALIRSEAQSLRGQTVEVTGAFKRRNLSGQPEKGAPEFEVQFWRYETAASVDEMLGTGNRISIEDLMAAEKLAPTPVTVIGKFRGGNLFGDLPYSSRKRGGDWIIKDDLYSVWVTGKGPSGDGWDLSIRATGDTVNWLKVTGIPRVDNGFIYLEATDVALSRPPTPSSSVAAAAGVRPATMKTSDPADVMFTIPVQGVEEAAADSVFAVQFTKPMDGTSFQGRVRLRYARTPEGERAFPNAAIGYDPVRRVLTVDPGEALQAGRVLECLLLPGIRDSQGGELKPAKSRAPQDPLQILRWNVAGQ
jgi:hypothetical protein